MKPPDDDDRAARLFDLLVAGTPLRIVDAVARRDPGRLPEVDAVREALASYALALEPVAPSPGLRDRVARGLAERPRGEKRRALVVLDMLVDHLTPGMPMEVPRARAIVPALRARIDDARRRGEPVVYLCDRHEPGDPELEAWAEHGVAGTPGAEVWPELAPMPGDPVVPHRTYSGFFESELESTLRALDVNAIVLTGCITELGLFVTASDALMRGFEVEVPADCQAGSSAVSEQVALTTLSVMRPVEPFPRR